MSSAKARTASYALFEGFDVKKKTVGLACTPAVGGGLDDPTSTDCLLYALRRHLGRSLAWPYEPL